MKNFLGKGVSLFVVTLGLALASCSDKAQQKEQNTDKPEAVKNDSTAATTDIPALLKAHQEDIQALWEMTFEGKKMAKYAPADEFVFVATDDGKQGLLLYFYKDEKDVDNFDGIALNEKQSLVFQGDEIVIKENGEEGDITTYFGTTDDQGFIQLFTVTKKDGKTTYTDDLDDPFDEKEAQSFISETDKDKPVPLNDTLGEWTKL